MPGTPEQVWDAIATANGISSWMMPTDLEEREGGAVVLPHGPRGQSEGTVTGWDPPRRLVYEEPDWAGLAGQDRATVTPLVTEFLVEATSGGTCVVRVVSSAFGTGADWEEEFFDEHGSGLDADVRAPAPLPDPLPGPAGHPARGREPTSRARRRGVAAMRATLGVDDVGQTVDVRGAKGEVERVGRRQPAAAPDRPVPGIARRLGYGRRDGARVVVDGYLFSDDAPAYVEREQPAWQAWLDGLGLERARDGTVKVSGRGCRVAAVRRGAPDHRRLTHGVGSHLDEPTSSYVRSSGSVSSARRPAGPGRPARRWARRPRPRRRR